MGLFRKKKEQENYNIVAKKKTKCYIMRFYFSNRAEWEREFKSFGDMKNILKDLEDDKCNVLKFIGNPTLFINKNEICYWTYEPKKISICEWFTNIADALGFVETLKLDKCENINEFFGKIEL